MLTNDKYKTAAQSMFGDPKHLQAMELLKQKQAGDEKVAEISGQYNEKANQARVTASSTEKTPVLTIADFLGQEIKKVNALKPNAAYVNSPEHKAAIDDYNESLTALYGISAELKIPDRDVIGILQRARTAMQTGDLTLLSWEEFKSLRNHSRPLAVSISGAGAKLLSEKANGKKVDITKEHFGPPTRYGHSSPAEVTRRGSVAISTPAAPQGGANPGATRLQLAPRDTAGTLTKPRNM